MPGVSEADSSRSLLPTGALASRAFGVVAVSSARLLSAGAARPSARPASASKSARTSASAEKKAKAARSQLDLAVGSPEADVAHLRDHVRSGARNHPGVYLMRGPHGEILYVGKSTQLRTRLLSYF